MFKQKLLSLFLILSLPVLPIYLSVTALADCLPPETTSRFCNKPHSADGKIHITVSMTGGLPADQQLIQNALNSWNAQSNTTNVVFESAPAGTTADISFVYTEDSSSTGSAGCAREDPATQSIYWGIEMSNRRLFLGDAEFAAVMMHEIGHFLGLAHTTDASVMRPGTDCSTPAGAQSVSAADAAEVARCRPSYCRRPIPPRPPSPPSGGGSSCYEGHELVEYCGAEGCSYEWQYVGWICN